MLSLSKRKPNSTYNLNLNIQAMRDQNSSGKGRPCKNDLNSTRDLSGCENGASWDAPLMVAKESMLA